MQPSHPLQPGMYLHALAASRFSVASLLIMSLLGIVGTPASAQTTSAPDDRLQIRNGLILWLDASAVNVESSNAKELNSTGVALAQWSDLSDSQRHFHQSVPEMQPRLFQTGGARSVRFNGDTQHMRSLGKPTAAESITLFIVAAPHQNPGDFRGLLSSNAPGRRDYESGLTVDLGPGPTTKLDFINVEGIGFGGANNLMNAAEPFGTLHTIEAVVDAATRKVQLTVDGKANGTRELDAKSIALDEMTLGARFYTNGPGEQIVRGPLRCDIAEVLLYNRVLDEADRKSVRDYLAAKHEKLAEALPQQLKLTPGVALVKAENPPPIQMLVPGFSVREIPIELTNVNNVRFREDGQLMTLGYNGDLHLLRDTDGDGVEDKAELFWKNEGSLRGPIGLLLTPPNYPKGRGAFVPSKGKVSLIVDTNNDDKADQEIVVATGWEEIPQNVDAVGIAMDKEGAIYFGLGTANYANAYLVDDQGKAAYDLKSDRGTVQRVAPDFSKRETVCTGVRFRLHSPSMNLATSFAPNRKALRGSPMAILSTNYCTFNPTVTMDFHRDTLHTIRM